VVATTADRRRQSSLIALQFQWGGVYEISVRDGKWFGVLVADPVAVLKASSAAKLQEALDGDWETRKPRTGQGAGSCSC
jgi:hypothetical protein